MTWIKVDSTLDIRSEHIVSRRRVKQNSITPPGQSYESMHGFELSTSYYEELKKWETCNVLVDVWELTMVNGDVFIIEDYPEECII